MLNEALLERVHKLETEIVWTREAQVELQSQLKGFEQASLAQQSDLAALITQAIHGTGIDLGQLLGRLETQQRLN